MYIGCPFDLLAAIRCNYTICTDIKQTLDEIRFSTRAFYWLYSRLLL